MLSHHYYKSKNRSGEYTRIRGLSRESKKGLILEHLKKNKTAKKTEFLDAFKDMNPAAISNLLQELKKEKKIIYRGVKRSGVWQLNESKKTK